jgi:hypothetical protein
MKLDKLMRRMKGKGYILAEWTLDCLTWMTSRSYKHSASIVNGFGLLVSLRTCQCAVTATRFPTSLGLLPMKITARAANHLHPFENSFMFLL